MRMTSPVGSIRMLTVLAGLMLAGSARAQSCKAAVDEMRWRYPDEGTFVTVASSQANKLSTLSRHVLLGWNGVQMSSVDHGRRGAMQFSDRLNTRTYPRTGASQNFSSHWTDVEYVDLWFAPDGSSATIRNDTWGYLIHIPQLTCSDGIMYGFGPPIANANGSRPALYVFSYYFGSVIG